MAQLRSASCTPKQRRSQETHRRLLEATRDLLHDAAFENLTVQQIVDRAGYSVGNFYQRFSSKEAMLPELLSLHYAELRLRVEETIAAGEGRNLAERVRHVVTLVVGMAHEQRGLIRTLALRHYQQPDSIPSSVRQEAADILGSVYSFLLGDGDEIEHPRPGRAVEVGLLMVAAAVRERVAFVGATQASTLQVDLDVFSDELSRALFAYLRSTDSQEGGGV
jgi:AcrR family transcriptional regulator